MRMALLLMGALCLSAALAMAPRAMAEEADAAIRAVIADQIGAFQRSDLDAAFAHASPGIQGKFGDPATFGRMVAQGYPMIWRPQQWEMGAYVDGPRGPTQSVLFRDAKGVLWEADYFMERVDGVWRIDGVQLRRLPGVAS